MTNAEWEAREIVEKCIAKDPDGLPMGYKTMQLQIDVFKAIQRAEERGRGNRCIHPSLSQGAMFEKGRTKGRESTLQDIKNAITKRQVLAEHLGHAMAVDITREIIQSLNEAIRKEAGK